MGRWNPQIISIFISFFLFFFFENFLYLSLLLFLLLLYNKTKTQINYNRLQGVFDDQSSNKKKTTLIEKDHLGDRSPEKDCC